MKVMRIPSTISALMSVKRKALVPLLVLLACLKIFYHLISFIRFSLFVKLK